MIIASPSCCLVYWPEELAVTVVEMKKVKYKELTVGEKCEIAVGKDTFTGLLYAWGTYVRIRITLIYYVG